MSNPPIDEWLSAGPLGEFTEPVQCELRADRFARQIRVRNLIENVAAGIGFILFGGLAIGSFWSGEFQIGGSAILTVLGLAIIVRELHRRARNLDHRPEEPCLVHLQRQYRRQYDALVAVPVWYIAPLVPGLTTFYAAITYNTAQATSWSDALERVLWPAAITVAVLAIVAALNWFAARGIRRKLSELEALA